MTTVSQIVQSGITTLDELKAALQLAMQLEFSTIPPYLCAQWSIDDDPDNVAGLIQGIVVQEMFHFALAGNMLTAIGATPAIADPAFLVVYPTNVLPGDIHQSLPVDLKPLSADQLLVFMQIENPEFPPVALLEAGAAPATIGDFYDTIAAGFANVAPTIDASAHFVTMGEAGPITSVADALAAITRIKEEGEGTQASPDQPPQDGDEIAHYYMFKEILVGKKLIQTNGKWDFDGPPVRLPTAFPFAKSTAEPNPSLSFSQAVTQLLIELQTCWTSDAQPDIGAMINLQTLGQGLIKDGILPEFRWVP